MREIREMYLIHDCILESKEEALRRTEGKGFNVREVFVGCEPKDMESKDMESKELSPYEYFGWVYTDIEQLKQEIEFERDLENE